MDTPPSHGFETRAIHAGQDPDPVTGSVVPAVHLATTFRQRTVGVNRVRVRPFGQPDAVFAGGTDGVVGGGPLAYAFASGLAAEDAVLRALLNRAIT